MADVNDTINHHILSISLMNRCETNRISWTSNYPWIHWWANRKQLKQLKSIQSWKQYYKVDERHSTVLPHKLYHQQFVSHAVEPDEKEKNANEIAFFKFQFTFRCINYTQRPRLPRFCNVFINSIFISFDFIFSFRYWIPLNAITDSADWWLIHARHPRREFGKKYTKTRSAPHR